MVYINIEKFVFAVGLDNIQTISTIKKTPEKDKIVFDINVSTMSKITVTNFRVGFTFTSDEIFLLVGFMSFNFFKLNS